MFSRTLPVLAALALAAGTTLVAQTAADNTKKDAKHAGRSVKDAVNPQKTDTDSVFGRVKELTAGLKVVIDVNNSVDKEFNLADKTVKVVMAKGLKVGDPVKVHEVDANGVKTVHIMKDATKGVKHGDKNSAAAEKKSS